MEDHSIAWMRKRIWLTPETMLGVDWSATGTSYETATIVPAEVTDVGMGTVNFDAADVLCGYIPVPYDLDPDKAIGYKIAWSMIHAGAAKDGSAEWILLVGKEKVGDAISLATTALDTVIGNDAYSDAATAATDWLLQWTSRGIQNSIGLTRADIEAGAFLTFSIELNAEVAETSTHFIGMMMDYAVMRTVGTGSHIDQPLQSDGQA